MTEEPIKRYTTRRSLFQVLGAGKALRLSLQRAEAEEVGWRNEIVR
jgi:hypothetical protein